MFETDADRDAALRALAEADPALTRVIDRHGPIALSPRRDYFASLARAIVSQQLSVKAAATILRRVVELMPAGALEPAAVLALDEAALRGAGLSRQKLTYLRDLAAAVDGGTLDLDALPALDDEAVIEGLTRIRGIGRWTAEMFLMFSLGRRDILPVDDLGFRNGVRLLYGLDAAPKPAELREFGERWRPYRSVATWYMWRIVEAGGLPPDDADPAGAE